MTGPRCAALFGLAVLAGCAAGGDGGPGRAAGTGDRVYDCNMRGSMAEGRYTGPLGNPGIDSAIVNQQVTEACLAGRPEPRVIGPAGLRRGGD